MVKKVHITMYSEFYGDEQRERAKHVFLRLLSALQLCCYLISPAETLNSCGKHQTVIKPLTEYQTQYKMKEAKGD